MPKDFDDSRSLNFRKRNPAAEEEIRNDEPAESPQKFFLTVFQGGVREARIYRAYPDDTGVSFIYSGPAPTIVDPEIARGTGHGGWKEKAAKTFKTSLVTAGGGIFFGIAVFIVIAGRLMLADKAEVTDFLGMGLGMLAVVAVSVIVILTSSIRRITNRLKEIDSLSPKELRKEAEKGKWCFRVTNANTDRVSIDPHDRASGGRAGSAARLLFRHEPTGNWKLSLLTKKDARAAVRAFRKVMGEGDVDVNIRLKNE